MNINPIVEDMIYELTNLKEVVDSPFMQILGSNKAKIISSLVDKTIPKVMAMLCCSEFGIEELYHFLIDSDQIISNTVEKKKLDFYNDAVNFIKNGVDKIPVDIGGVILL